MPALVCYFVSRRSRQTVRRKLVLLGLRLHFVFVVVKRLLLPTGLHSPRAQTLLLLLSLLTRASTHSASTQANRILGFKSSCSPQHSIILIPMLILARHLTTRRRVLFDILLRTGWSLAMLWLFRLNLARCWWFP